MNFVFLDLEWNNAYSKKHKKSINEIIEIGAVKLSEDRLEIGRFDCIIHSQITKSLGDRFTELTGISNCQMEDGISFEEAARKFEEWMGSDNLVITWSNSDLYAVSDNFSTFLPNRKIGFIEKYLDLQKFFQSVYPQFGKNQVSLKTAAESLGINLEELSLHRASDDSALCAMIFEKIYEKGDFRKFTVDATKPEFFERLSFKPFIVKDVKSPYVEPRDLIFKCRKCDKAAAAINDWAIKNDKLYAEFRCPECRRRFIGMLRIKRYYDKTKIRKWTVSIRNFSENTENKGSSGEKK